MMPVITASASKIARAMDSTREIFFPSRYCTTGRSNTANKTAKAKGIKMFCATLINRQIKNITRN